MNILNKKNMWKDYFFGRFWPVVFTQNQWRLHTSGLCIAMEARVFEILFFSWHGRSWFERCRENFYNPRCTGDVHFTFFFKPDLTNFSLNRLDLCSNPTRLRGYFFSQFLCVTYAYVYSISSIGIYGKHFRACYSVNYVNKINEVNVFDIKHSF